MSSVLRLFLVSVCVKVPVWSAAGAHRRTPPPQGVWPCLESLSGPSSVVHALLSRCRSRHLRCLRCSLSPWQMSPFFTPQGSPILPGTCWCFVGAEGTLAVSLSHPVKVTHVTVDHLPRYNSPTGDIKSAIRDFEVYVSEKRCWKPSSLTPDQLRLMTGNNPLDYRCDLLPQGMKAQAEGTFLGRFRYDKWGEPTQTFSLPVSFKRAQIRLILFIITYFLLSGSVTRFPLISRITWWIYASSPTGVRGNTRVSTASVSTDGWTRSHHDFNLSVHTL